MQSPATVTTALRRFVGDYRRLYSPTHHKRRVLDWLCACRTSALGGRMLSCACGWSAPVYNSCTDRHCPQCRAGVRAEWLATRCEQLLPVPHFQVVFTLPGALRGLAADNPRIVYGLMFTAASETLGQLAAQRLDARLGVMAVLHTWASNMTLHPHVHCLVTAGGLRTDQAAWVESRPDYLFPTRVMAAMVRGKVTQGLRKAFVTGELFVRGEPAHADVAFEAAVRMAHRHRWVVHVEAPNGRPVEAVAKYLARYVGGVAIGDSRMVAVTSSHVSYKTRTGVMTVEGLEFVRRFAMHILPRRFRKVRYYGLYAPGSAHTLWERARTLLGAPKRAERPESPKRTCPTCGADVAERSIPGLRYCRPSRPPQARGPP